jgi:hypothetical protein
MHCNSFEPEKQGDDYVTQITSLSCSFVGKYVNILITIVIDEIHPQCAGDKHQLTLFSLFLSPHV